MSKLAEALRRACNRIEKQTKVTESIIIRDAHPDAKMSDGSHVIQTLNTHIHDAITEARAALAEHDANGGWCFDMDKAPMNGERLLFCIKRSGIYAGERVLDVRFNTIENRMEYLHSHGWFSISEDWVPYCWMPALTPPTPPRD